jgi:large subunit ribosomal protein L22
MANSQIVRAYAENVALTPRKVALVASLVRNRTVADALVILGHTPKRAALPVIKAINSAKANAINNHELDGKTLSISTLSVTTGTRLKRYNPSARGRMLPYQKKTANILVELTGDIKPKKPSPKTVSSKSSPAKSDTADKTKTTVKKEDK